jgi:hypothetical protein
MRLPGARQLSATGRAARPKRCITIRATGNIEMSGRRSEDMSSSEKTRNKIKVMPGKVIAMTQEEDIHEIAQELKKIRKLLDGFSDNGVPWRNGRKAAPTG